MLSATLFVSFVMLLNLVNNSFLVDVPLSGGTVTEGVMGTPRFINPVLAVADVEKDINALVYSGLMKKDGIGNIIPDLADSFTVSPDGLIYTFTLKQNLTFHDGSLITAADVVYTFNQIKNPAIKSPKKVNWDGVTIENTDDRTIIFTLKQPFASFLENTTLGILPAHLWKEVSDAEFSFSDLNLNAVGSGPFKIKNINKKSSGIPSGIKLSSFKNYAGGEPYIKTFVFDFYPNESDMISAYKSGSIDNVSAISPVEAVALQDDGARTISTPLPRIFGLFFNQTEAPIFTDKNVVKAFDMAINKNRIIDTVLHGYGKTIDGPLPLYMSDQGEVAQYSEQNKTDALALLKKAGWIPGTDGVLSKTSTTITTPATKGKPAQTRSSSTRLTFSIATGEAPELRKAAELIAEDLKSIGVEVDVKTYETGTLNQNVIRPRKYDALFFGEIVSHESDFFAFWHSSQRNDPGLNIAQYANTKVDQLLESALVTADANVRLQKYKDFEKEVQKDMPAIFVYSPDFIYVVDKNLQGFDMSHATAASDRFININKWYEKTDKVYKIFIKN